LKTRKQTKRKQLHQQWVSAMNNNNNAMGQIVNLTNGISLADNPGSNNNNFMNNNPRAFNRPKPIVDPSRITPTELTVFKVSDFIFAAGSKIQTQFF